ncbi:TIGR04211 family SH3 domain-containing protein [Thiomicrospira pelophila]|uniref:TIGR04211 family SH3 domain-containing protein n=1 Tax=Thiomicrospira pelophila TaxID=934 RepID=UPI0004A784C7|nr:TIGR04211 family SH3 domain-containing protein [Thiomicrospira pelophila]
MRKFNSFKRFLPIVGLAVMVQPMWLIPSLAHAEEYTHYISDSIEVPLRRGAGNEFRIIRMLEAGSPIKVLEVGDSNWSRVEYIHNGATLEGWVNKIAIQNDTPSKVLLAEQTARLNKLNAQYKALQSEHNELKTRANTTSQELETIKQEKFELDKEFDHLTSISGGAIELDQQNQEMRRLIGDLESQNVIMREQIARAEDTVKRQWFLAGAGVLLAGLLLGRFFRIPKRRGGWDKI